MTEAQIRAAQAHAPIILAVDRGADRAAAHGFSPQAIFGDLDSLSSVDAWTARGVPVHRIPEQDSVDFEKALEAVEAPAALSLGFLGGRVDHELAVFNALVRHADRPVVLLGEEDCICCLPRSLSLDLPVGTRVSLFPMDEVTGLSSQGLEWPLDGLTLSPTGRVGTSNRATGPVQITCGDGACLLILPATQLEALLEGLNFQNPGSALG